MHNRIPATLAVTLMFVILLLNQVSADSFYPNAGVDVTDEATPLELHHYQLLFNYEHDEFNYVAPLGIPEISVKYGVTRNFDVGIQLPYIIDYQDINGLSGYGDVSFGFKYLLTPLGEKRLLASLIGSMKVYSADFSKELSDGATDYSIHAAFSYEMDKWKYHLNYGYTFWGSIPGYDTKPSPYYRFKTDYVTSNQWSFSAEVYGTGSPNLDYIGAPMQSTVKTTWQVNDSLSFDLGMAFGLNPDAPVRRYLFSITYEY